MMVCRLLPVGDRSMIRVGSDGSCSGEYDRGRTCSINGWRRGTWYVRSKLPLTGRTGGARPRRGVFRSIPCSTASSSLRTMLASRGSLIRMGWPLSLSTTEKSFPSLLYRYPVTSMALRRPASQRSSLCPSSAEVHWVQRAVCCSNSSRTSFSSSWISRTTRGRGALPMGPGMVLERWRLEVRRDRR